MKTFSRRAVVAGFGAMPFVARSGFAQAWPSRTIRILVPSAAGGYDTYARIMAPEIQKRLGVAVYVENKPGANGIIGMTDMQRSPPDGYSILFAHSGALTINPSIVKNMPLDTETDLAPIALPVTVPMIWSANPGSRFNSLKDVIDAAREAPGKIDYANPSTGSLPHLIFEAFKQRHNLNIVPIPFNGTPPAQQEVVAGRIPLMVDSLGAAWGHIESKRVRVIAVTTKARVAQLPQVPTAIEQGVEDQEFIGWYGYVAPKGTPAEVIGRLNATINEIVQDPDVSARIVKLGAIPQQTTPEDLTRVLVKERDLLGKVARAAGLQPK
jgi:tripartite-type tricarboxylate transporter receptor subunit TctC